MRCLRIVYALIFVAIIKVNAQTGINTNAPISSSLFELNDTNKGLLIPKIAVPNLLNKYPVEASIKDGLIIYNTNDQIKQTILQWNSTKNQNNGAWSSHLFFSETPKTAVFKISGDNINALDNADAGWVTYIGGASNSFISVSSGHLPNLAFSKANDNTLRFSLGAGVYLIEVSLLLNAVVPDSGRGELIGGSYYNMGYFLDIYGASSTYFRVERGVVSEALKDHRVSFIAMFELAENTSNPIYTLYTHLGRRLGSSHRDEVKIIASGSYYKITKIK